MLSVVIRSDIIYRLLKYKLYRSIAVHYNFKQTRRDHGVEKSIRWTLPKLHELQPC
jgi:hypothetical protein